MLKWSAVCSGAKKVAWAVMTGALLISASPASADWNKPWTAEDRALVIDAYEFNPIDWQVLTADKRIAGFINKASDGLPPEWKCAGKSGDEQLLCKNRWWKYSVTKELYMTRRAMAKTLGLKWGAYHLARPGNPREQADHFVDFAEPAPDDLIAIDIEDNTSDWMSLSDAEIFADQMKIRTGRYPVLYTNGSTAKWISDYKEKYTLLSRLPLWYARYRSDITGMFPETTWPTYALWQFSSMHNCKARTCPYRVKGAKQDIDVNVSPYDVAGLRAAWPFNTLMAPPETAQPDLAATLRAGADRLVSSLSGGLATLVSLRQPVAERPDAAKSVGAAAQGRGGANNPSDPQSANPEAVDPAVTGSIAETESALRETTEAKPVDPEPSAPKPSAERRTGATPTAASKVTSAFLAAYGAVVPERKRIDPLKLLTDVALSEHGAAQASAAIGAAAKADIAVTRETPLPTFRPDNSAHAVVFETDAHMGEEMRQIAAIVPEMRKAIVLAPPSAGRAPAWAAEKSKVRAWMQAAASEASAAERAMPAFGSMPVDEEKVDHQRMPDGQRGGRPSADIAKGMAALAPVDRRVALAFEIAR